MFGRFLHKFVWIPASVIVTLLGGSSKLLFFSAFSLSFRLYLSAFSAANLLVLEAIVVLYQNV